MSVCACIVVFDSCVAMGHIQRYLSSPTVTFAPNPSHSFLVDHTTNTSPHRTLVTSTEPLFEVLSSASVDGPAHHTSPIAPALYPTTHVNKIAIVYRHTDRNVQKCSSMCAQTCVQACVWPCVQTCVQTCSDGSWFKCCLKENVR